MQGVEQIQEFGRLACKNFPQKYFDSDFERRYYGRYIIQIHTPHTDHCCKESLREWVKLLCVFKFEFNLGFDIFCKMKKVIWIAIINAKGTGRLIWLISMIGWWTVAWIFLINNSFNMILSTARQFVWCMRIYVESTEFHFHVISFVRDYVCGLSLCFKVWPVVLTFVMPGLLSYLSLLLPQ